MLAPRITIELRLCSEMQEFYDSAPWLPSS